PGSKLQFYSFDHDTGRLVIEGAATVSADGLSVTTDPNTGITKPGWHGLTPPGGPGGPGPGGPPEPMACELPAELPKTPGTAAFQAVAASCTPVSHPPVALDLITQEFGGLLSHPELTWAAPAKGQLVVKIEVDGPLEQFMKRLTPPRAAGTTFTPLATLTSQTFTLTSGAKTKALVGTSKSYDEIFGPGGFQKLNADRLYGAKIKVTETRTGKGVTPSIDVKTFYLYRWVSVVYAPEAQQKTALGGSTNREGNTAAFVKTLNDGPGNRSSTKQVLANVPKSVMTRFSVRVEAEHEFQVNTPTAGSKAVTWRFDP